MRIDPAGNVGIGTTAPGSKLEVIGDIATRSENGYASHSSTVSSDTFSPINSFRRSRGTLASPTAVVNGDALGGIIADAFTGTNWTRAASVIFEADGAVSNADMPTRMAFSTTPDGGAVALERMRITNSGNVGIATTNPQALLQIGDLTKTNPSPVALIGSNINAASSIEIANKSSGTNADSRITLF
ncbi:MAG: hypothetical protein EOP50_19305, partial [Sphingobacteriales bacterium]